jgi:hypothetical protein
MTVTQQLEKIKEDICDNYCKYPEKYLEEIKNPDEAMTEMYERVCENCPLNKL